MENSTNFFFLKPSLIGGKFQKKVLSLINFLIIDMMNWQSFLILDFEIGQHFLIEEVERGQCFPNVSLQQGVMFPNHNEWT